MLTYNTTQLLYEVKKKLVSMSRDPIENHGMASTSYSRKNSVSSLLTHVTVLKENKIETNELSRLMACAHKLLCEINNFYHLPDTSSISSTPIWPCEPIYNGEVMKYSFYEHRVDVVILSEKCNNMHTESCFIIFNFLHDPLAYHVEEYKYTSIPCLDGKNDRRDEVCLERISSMISNIVKEFCIKIVCRKSKLSKIKEFGCDLGVKPFFTSTIPKKPAIKTVKYDGKQIKLPEFYFKLANMHKNSEEKPNEAARIIATIHDLMLHQYQFNSSISTNQWPGGLNYQNDIIAMFYSLGSTEESKEEPIHWFNMSLITSDEMNELYFVLRYIGSKEVTCTKKIVKTLIPSFQESEILKDKEKITNISLWIHAIHTNFCEKVMEGNYRSTLFSSLRSSVSTSVSTSRDDPEDSTSE